MTCTSSCLIGGGQKGGDKIKNNLEILKPYSIATIKKLFKHFKQTYDKENGLTENIVLFSVNVPDSEEKIKEWIKKKKPRKTKAKKITKKVSEYKKEVNTYKKRKNCSFKLSSKKKQLKEMAEKHNISVAKKAKVAVLRKAIKAFKKENCPAVSKMNKKQLIEFIKNHKVPVVKFTGKNKLKTFRRTIAEKKSDAKGYEEYKKITAKYDSKDMIDLNVGSLEVTDVSPKSARKRALDLHKKIKASFKIKKKTPKRKMKSKKLKRNKVKFQTPKK